MLVIYSIHLLQQQYLCIMLFTATDIFQQFPVFTSDDIVKRLSWFTWHDDISLETGVT